MKIKFNDVIHFGVDELEVYGTFYNYEKLLKGLDDENSDFVHFGEFTLLKTDRLKDYLFKIDFIKDNHRCFAFYVGKRINDFITTKNYFKVYGSAFKYFTIEEIVNFIKSNIINDSSFKRNSNVINTLELRIKRFDLALDIKKDLEKDIQKNIKRLEQKGNKYFGDKGKLETYYIGEYKVRDNRGLLIRIYDKIADIKSKNKQSLYGNYLKEESITRFEIEFRSEIAKALELDDLLDLEYLFNLFILYIEKHTQLFQKLKTAKVKKLPRTQKRVDINELKTNEALKIKYVGVFLGYATKIHEVIGYCPTKILIEHKLINKKTKEKIVGSIIDGKFDINKFIFGGDE